MNKLNVPGEHISARGDFFIPFWNTWDIPTSNSYALPEKQSTFGYTNVYVFNVKLFSTINS